MLEGSYLKPNRFSPRSRVRWIVRLFTGVCLLLTSSLLAFSNPAAVSGDQPEFAPLLQDTGLSFLRLLGAFAIVIAVLFIGVWILKNYQRFALRNGAPARLNILETKSLGNRQLLFVVGYEQQRMLLGASPGGITLVAMLPESTILETPLAAPEPSFSSALAGVLIRKPSP